MIINTVNTREEGCKESIKKSRKVAILARRCSDEFKAKCDIKISIHGTVYISLTLHKGFMSIFKKEKRTAKFQPNLVLLLKTLLK